MKSPDSFEQKLQHQPPRQLPPAWRGEILVAARQENGGRREAKAGWLTNLLWPHPIAWGGLAASWVLILALNFAARDPASPGIAREAAPPSPQARELLREQERMFAELIGPVEKSAAVEPRRRDTQPRSQITRVESLNG